MTPNLSAFLAVIRACEGTAGEEGYRALFGWRPGNGRVFSSFADHPRVKVPYRSTYTTAAGAYQMLASTYDDARAHTGVTDFSPASQDRCAVYLIQRRGALADVENGRLRAAIDRCNREWASLPGSPYGQPVRTMEFCERVFRAHGGRQTDIPAKDVTQTLHNAQPEAQRVPIVTLPKEPRMGATLLAGLIPSILSLFSDRAQAAISRATGASPDVAAKFAADIAKQIEVVSGVTVSDPASAMKAAAVVASDPVKVAALESHATGFVLAEIGGGVQSAAEEYAAINRDLDDDAWWRIPLKFLFNMQNVVTLAFLAGVGYFVPPLAKTVEKMSPEAAMGLIVLIFAVIGVVSGRWLRLAPKEKE